MTVVEVASNPVFLFPCSSWWPVCVRQNFVASDIVHSLRDAHILLALARAATQKNAVASGSMHYYVVLL
jgi:hypothetical protein